MFRPYLIKVPFNSLWVGYSLIKNERPHWHDGKIRINSCVPPYPSKAFDRFFDILINQKRLPHTINFAITANCPYKCQHCCYGGRKKEDLTTSQILNLVQQIKDLGTAILGITGGEPMTRSDIEEIVAAASPELTTIIFTTGFNFNKKRAEELYKSNVGCVTIGIEHTNSEIQDKIRGEKGSLQNAINAIKLCNEVGIYTAIATIGTREKIYSGEINRIYDLANSLNVGELRLIFPISTGRWAGFTNENLKKEELKLHEEFHKKYNRMKSGPVVASLAYLESDKVMGCNTGYNYLYIDSSGEVCPCDLTPLSFGNIKEEPLSGIWTRMGQYFPQPRSICLMSELSSKTISNSYPINQEESKKLVLEYNKRTPLPKVHKILRKKINKK
jgi:MoaA/NifB/PqqE/SkfB family radical SAM enzyme